MIKLFFEMIKKKKMNIKELIILLFYITIGLVACFLFLLDDIVRFLIKKVKKIGKIII